MIVSIYLKFGKFMVIALHIAIEGFTYMGQIE